MLLPSASALGQTGPLTLDRATVARLAAEHGPSVLIAQERVGEARALHVGASIPSTVNPELTAYVGPRWTTPNMGTDFFFGVVVPFEVSGAPAQRVRVADERTRLAESEVETARRKEVTEALDLWARARGADERAHLDTARLELDGALVRAAEARRNAGTSGDIDVALARSLEAQAAARKVSEEQELQALLEQLRARLGLPAGQPVALGGALQSDEPPPLEALLARLRNQPAMVRALAAIRASQTDESLQRRLGYPVPRVTAGAGQDPETFVHVGIEVPLPVFQRNQTNVAVAEARTGTARAEYTGALALAEADLRAAYANYVGAREAARALEAAEPSLDDAEHLATRGYELGKTTLTDVTTTRREVAAARLALVEARVALARARIALDVLAGTLP